MSWLLNSVSKNVPNQILHSGDVATARRILHTKYAGSNLSRKFALKKEICNMMQRDQDVATYFERLVKLWQEFDSISGRKLCNIMADCEERKVNAKEKEEDKAMQFIMGLNESHAQIKTYILAMKELPDLDVIYDMISQDESQKAMTKSTYTEASAMYAHQQVPPSSNKPHGRGFQTKNRTRLYCIVK
ncbi:hypothetical protein QQ045_013167 [Rhodiola kirilowii]